MRRVEPAFPDLLPITHRLGACAGGEGGRVDPVEMRLVCHWVESATGGDRTLPRRPVRFIVHSEAARRHHQHLAALVAAGSGALVVLDTPLEPAELPAPTAAAQVTVMAPWVAPIWGGRGIPDLAPFRCHGAAAGVLLALAPAPRCQELVGDAVEEAARAGAEFVLAMPLSVPAEDRHRAYDEHGGEAGDGALEDLLFHTDLLALTLELEREASRACRRAGLREGLPGPATSHTPGATVAAANALLTWARRLDLLDGIGSAGWQLRRAARALLASGRDPAMLVAEDNLRIVPGFNPYVEAFARSLWSGGGEPFEEALSRWVAH